MAAAAASLCLVVAGVAARSASPAAPLYYDYYEYDEPPTRAGATRQLLLLAGPGRAAGRLGSRVWMEPGFPNTAFLRKKDKEELEHQLPVGVGVS